MGYLAKGKYTNTFRKFHAYNKFKSIVGVRKDKRNTVPLKKAVEKCVAVRST